MKDDRIKYLAKFLAILYLGYLIGTHGDFLGLILTLPIEILGLIALLIVTIDWIIARLRKNDGRRKI